MTVDARKLCVNCAWREHCVKRFSMECGGLHCPDYSEDVSLRKARSHRDETKPDGFPEET